MKYIIINKWQLKDSKCKPHYYLKEARAPSSIKLYESKSIEGLLLDHREVKPLAINDWLLIQNKLIGVKN